MFISVKTVFLKNEEYLFCSRNIELLIYICVSRKIAGIYVE